MRHNIKHDLLKDHDEVVKTSVLIELSVDMSWIYRVTRLDH
jgi:hypothetical protein